MENKEKTLLTALVAEAEFIDPDYPEEITGSMKEKFKDLSPSNLVGSGKIGIDVYKVSYGYRTRRGHDREGTKYLFIPEKEAVEEDLKKKFLDTIRDFNKENPCRAIANVQVKNIERYAVANVSI